MLKSIQLASLVLVVAFVMASAPIASGQGHCTAFTAVGTGSYYVPGQNSLLPFGGWIADIYFTIGVEQLHAKAIYDASEDVWKKAPEPGVNTSIATERGKLTFDDGSKLEMPGHFVAPLEKSADGVFRLNEAGKIENGTGAFANVSGSFTTHGVFGPGVTRPDPQAVLGAILQTQGTLCLNKEKK